MVGPELPRPFPLGLALRRDDHARARGLGELQREYRHAARTLGQDDAARSDMGGLEKRVVCGDAGAGKSGCLLEREVLRNGHDSLLVQHGFLGQHAVHRSAERASVISGEGDAVDPGRKECCGDPFSTSEAGDRFADLDYLACAVRGGDDRSGLGAAMGPPRDREIAVVQ